MCLHDNATSKLFCRNHKSLLHRAVLEETRTRSYSHKVSPEQGLSRNTTQTDTDSPPYLKGGRARRHTYQYSSPSYTTLTNCSSTVSQQKPGHVISNHSGAADSQFKTNLHATSQAKPLLKQLHLLHIHHPVNERVSRQPNLSAALSIMLNVATQLFRVCTDALNTVFASLIDSFAICEPGKFF